MLKKILKVLAEPVKKYVGKKESETALQAVCRSLSSTFAMIAMGCISVHDSSISTIFVLATTFSALFYTFFFVLHDFDGLKYQAILWKPIVGYFSIFFNKVSGIVIFIVTNLVARGFGIEAPIKDIAGSIITCLLCYMGGVLFIMIVLLLFVAAVNIIYFIRYSKKRIHS